MSINYSISGRAVTDAELAYAEITGLTTFSGSTAQDVTDLTITFTARGRPFMLRTYWPVVTNQSGVAGVVAGTINDTANSELAAASAYLTTVSGARVAILAERRLSTVAVGTQVTYKTRILGPANSSYQIAGTTSQTAFLQAVEI